jgi:RNA polymerase-interacting CarD/CdnL/TRCF family regulator
VAYTVGETVVHPLHGVGTITDLVDKEFQAGSSRRYYEISIADGLLWVPVEEPGLGLRRLTNKGELARCQEILQGSPSIPATDPRGLHRELARHLRDGTVFAQCEVVRDVTALGWKKPLVGAMADLRRVALNVLCQEWAAVAEVPLLDATASVNTYLGQGKKAHHG